MRSELDFWWRERNTSDAVEVWVGRNAVIPRPRASFISREIASSCRTLRFAPQISWNSFALFARATYGSTLSAARATTLLPLPPPPPQAVVAIRIRARVTASAATRNDRCAALPVGCEVVTNTHLSFFFAEQRLLAQERGNQLLEHRHLALCIPRRRTAPDLSLATLTLLFDDHRLAYTNRVEK